MPLYDTTFSLIYQVTKKPVLPTEVFRGQLREATLPTPVMPPPVMPPTMLQGMPSTPAPPTKMGREKAERAHGFFQPARAAASKQRRRAAGTTETGFPSV